MTQLLTGGTGFVGSYLAKHLLEQNQQIVTIRRDLHTTALQKLGIDKKISYVNGNLCDNQLVTRTIRDYDVDIVIHVAADAIVKQSIADPSITFSNNANSTINIAEASRKLSVKRIFYFSSDKVLGNAIPPYKEDTIPQPIGPYETSKYVSEKILESYSATYGIPLTISRSANIFAAFDQNSRIIPNTLRDAISGKSPCIFNDIEAKREYIYAPDVADAVWHLIKNKHNGIFNIGSGETLNQKEVVLTILKHFPEVKPIYKDPPDYSKHEIGNQCLDSSKIRTTGWTHKYSFENAIAETIKMETA